MARRPSPRPAPILAVTAAVACTAVALAPAGAGAASGSPLREGVRNPSSSGATRETQVISRVTGATTYGTRQSNVATGADAGGAAIYGCRRPTRECIRANNLVGGLAAAFASSGTPLALSANEGTPPGTPALRVDPALRGEVANLNAELWGGFTPETFLARLQTTGVLTPAPTGPSGPAGGDLTGTYPAPALRDGAVSTAKLATDAVDSARIADGAVQTADVADGAVTQAKLGGPVDATTVTGRPPSHFSSGAGDRSATDVPITSAGVALITSPATPVRGQSHAILAANTTVENTSGGTWTVNCNLRRAPGADILASTGALRLEHLDTEQISLNAIDDAPSARQWELRCNTSNGGPGISSLDQSITATYLHDAQTIP